VVAGIGGTGVITIGQLLGMAAHLEGKGVVTQDAAGLAQKGGATWSHVQIARTADAIYTTRVDAAEADLVLGCDAIVTADHSTLALMREGRTTVVLNTHGSPTGAFIEDADWRFPSAACEAAIERAVGRGSIGRFDASVVALQALGDAVYSNMVMLGYAWQRGRIPLSRASLMRAIELNGVQVANNRSAFEWGRACGHDLAAVMAELAPGPAPAVESPSLESMVELRAAYLAAYQDAGYAASYRAVVEKVQAAEAPLQAGHDFTEAVARYLFRLMAYKDEYEVARLHTQKDFSDQIAAMFEGDYRIVHHLAPPLVARRNARGQLVKRPFGPWVRVAFRALARLKFLRGGPFDPFGYTAERRRERALVAEYRDDIARLLPGLTRDNLALAVDIARLPEDIRGYGHIKQRQIEAARARREALMARWPRR
jgi:indolepyruvate ferredoxin oxidoreductase